MPNRPLWKIAVQYTLLLFIALGSLACVSGVVIWLYPPAFAAGVGMIDSGSMCSSGDVLRGAAKREAEVAHRKRFEAASRKVRSDPAGYSLWETPRGRYWIPSGSDASLPALLAQQESNIYEVGSPGIRAGDVVLDCGAHIGTYVKVALDAGAKTVVAIEPAPDNVECLRRNFPREIAAGRVIVYAKGVWDKEELLPLYEDPKNSAADTFVVDSGHHVVKSHIPLTTIDKLTRELGIGRVNVIKMDIKGATQKALDGARGVLGRDKPRIALSTEEDSDDPRRLAGFIQSLQLGYRVSCGMCGIENLKLFPEVLLIQ